MKFLFNKISYLASFSMTFATLAMADQALSTPKETVNFKTLAHERPEEAAHYEPEVFKEVPSHDPEKERFKEVHRHDPSEVGKVKEIRRGAPSEVGRIEEVPSEEPEEVPIEEIIPDR